MRRAAVVVFLVLGIVLTPLAILGLWTQVVLLDSARFVDLADDLLDREDVRDAIGVEVADQIVAEEALARPFEGLIADTVSSIASTELFREAFRISLQDMHGQIEAGDDTLVLDLAAILDPLREQVARVVPIAINIPTDIGFLTITSRDDQPVLWTTVELADRISIGAIVGVVVAFALVVLLAESHWRMLGVAGAIVVVWALLFVLALPALRNAVTAGIPDDTIKAGARGAFTVVTRSLQLEALLFALIGVVVAGVGFVLDLARSRRPAAIRAPTT